VAKAGAPPFVVVLFCFLHAILLVLWTNEAFKATIRSSCFCFIFFRWACHGGGFLGKLVFCLLLSFAACGPCEKGRKSERKVDFRINVISAALSEGSLSNLSAFLCFRAVFVCEKQLASVRQRLPRSCKFTASLQVVAWVLFLLSSRS
jgi:hypothetical protein